MDVGQVGNNSVSACPYCDQLFTVKTRDGWLDSLMGLHNEHMVSSPACREAARNAPSLEESLGALRPQFEAADAERRKRADDNSDNGRLGWWRVSGIRHEAIAMASSAPEAIEKCANTGLVGTWEGPEAQFVGRDLPDVFSL